MIFLDVTTEGTDAVETLHTRSASAPIRACCN